MRFGDVMIYRDERRVVVEWQGSHLAHIDPPIFLMLSGGSRVFFVGEYLVEAVYHEWVYNRYVIRRCTSIGIVQSWLWMAEHYIEWMQPRILHWLARQGLCAFPKPCYRWTWDLLWRHWFP